jgi:hypothetical protein
LSLTSKSSLLYVCTSYCLTYAKQYSVFILTNRRMNRTIQCYHYLNTDIYWQIFAPFIVLGRRVDSIKFHSSDPRLGTLFGVLLQGFKMFCPKSRTHLSGGPLRNLSTLVYIKLAASFGSNNHIQSPHLQILTHTHFII